MKRRRLTALLLIAVTATSLVTGAARKRQVIRGWSERIHGIFCRT